MAQIEKLESVSELLIVRKAQNEREDRQFAELVRTAELLVKLRSVSGKLIIDRAHIFCIWIDLDQTT